MQSSSLLQLLVAEALRTTIRMLNLFAEARPHTRSLGGAQSLPRALLAANCAAGARQALVRLRGYGDLLAPVSTLAEIAQRDARLALLAQGLPPSPGLMEHAQRTWLDAAPEELAGELRGLVLQQEELSLRTIAARLESRFEQSRDADSAGLPETVLQHCTQQIHAEAAAWRFVERSALANRLIADRGFVDTYAQARKCARVLLRQAAKAGYVAGDGAAGDAAGDSPPDAKVVQLRELQRWNDSLRVQFELLGTVGDWRSLANQSADIAQQLADLLSMASMHSALQPANSKAGRRKSGKKKKRARRDAANSAPVWLRNRLEARRQEVMADLLNALQRLYGESRSNFHRRVVSQMT